jgi:L-seryl-tRNA(Ser) seleniumtransferase
VEEDELKARGLRLLQGIGRDKASLVESTFTTGGGSLPDESFPSLSVRLHARQQADRILRDLREARPPVIGVISDGAVELNLATLEDDDIPHLRALLDEILGE